MDWQSAQEQITGWQKPKHRCFTSRTEAQRFLNEDTTKQQGFPITLQAENVPFFTSDPLNSLEVPMESVLQPPGNTKSKKFLHGNKEAKLADSEYSEEDYPPGTGPLPPGSVDGFDPNVVFDPDSGTVVYKTKEQRQTTKLAPTGESPIAPVRVHTDGSSLGNGTAGAFAGIGVYFGPGDLRSVMTSQSN